MKRQELGVPTASNQNEGMTHMTDNQNTKLIPLSQGKFAIVDIGEFAELNKRKWCINNYGYAVAGSGTILMHRIIMKAARGFSVDHINHNTLDNRRINLRIANQQQNAANQMLRPSNKSGYKGVSFFRQGQRKKRWIAVIHFNYKRKPIGYFNTALEAALAYDKKAEELFGEFAATNKSLGLL